MLVRFDPFREVDRLAEQIDQVFRRGTASSVPMDAVRRGNQVMIYFDLPGIDPETIDLTVERDVLTVTATRRFERRDDEEVLARERPEGEFTRRILLGESLDTSAIQASYDQGVLTVTLPVAEAAQPRKISVGRGRQAIEAEATEASG